MALQLDALPPVAHERVLTAIQEILEAPQWDRRATRRLPYFGPVVVALPDSPSVNLSAFARDISEGGVGLVHLMPLKEGEVILTLPLPSGQNVVLRTEIVWCRDFGDGWYASGARFLDVF